uniref:Uncharacterized protein n=1 Tax=Nelumbo nucifera TaxID=4432 RepID=A0A822YFU0_NELNU|nr:TPA_asm: hypothetical protein HUJ06_031293 [Nelumbo nucifera]
MEWRLLQTRVDIWWKELYKVAAGELELNHECNLMHWSPEDFETKL